MPISPTFLRILFLANLCLAGTYLNAMNHEEEAPYRKEVLALCGQIQDHSDLPEDISLTIVGFSDCLAGEDVRKREENQALREEIRKAINCASTLPELLAVLPNKRLKFRHKANKLKRKADTVQRNTKNKQTKRSLFPDLENPDLENNDSEEVVGAPSARLLDFFNDLKSENQENYEPNRD